MMKYLKTYEQLSSHNQKKLDDLLLKHSKNIASFNYIKELVEKGANVNVRDFLGNTPLMLASQKSAYNIVKFLISKGADVNAVNRNGLSVIFHLALSGFYSRDTKGFKTFSLLIENGVDLSFQDKQGKDIFDHRPELLKYVKDNFPEEYEEYLIKKSVEKYNL